MALDLSAKPSTGPAVFPETCYSPRAAPSPSASLSSDLDTSVDRPPSSTGLSSAGEGHHTDSEGLLKPAAVKAEPGSPGDYTSRPVYPYDTPAMFPHLAANAASLSAAGMFAPFAGAGSPGGLPAAGFGAGLLDNALSMSSPITQYLQQKRRRSESKMKAPSHDFPGSGPPNSAADITSTSRENSALSDGMSSPGLMSTGDSPCGLEPATKRQKDEPTLEDRRQMSYLDRRRKNNEAAKRSRDARRMKEDEIAMRAAFLEQENLKLRAQVSILKTETAKLHYMLYNRL